MKYKHYENVIYLIAVGLQVFILIFLFGKRQIMRFTWGSKKTPNSPLGSGLPKKIKKDICNSLALVADMHWEPKLIDYTPEDSPNIYRVKTIDDVQTFFSEITRTKHSIPRLHKISFYKLLNILLEKNFIDNSCEDSILICTKLYEQARYTNDKSVSSDQGLDTIIDYVARNNLDLSDIPFELISALKHIEYNAVKKTQKLKLVSKHEFNETGLDRLASKESVTFEKISPMQISSPGWIEKTPTLIEAAKKNKCFKEISNDSYEDLKSNIFDKFAVSSDSINNKCRIKAKNEKSTYHYQPQKCAQCSRPVLSKNFTSHVLVHLQNGKEIDWISKCLLCDFKSFRHNYFVKVHLKNVHKVKICVLGSHYLDNMTKYANLVWRKRLLLFPHIRAAAPKTIQHMTQSGTAEAPTKNVAPIKRKRRRNVYARGIIHAKTVRRVLCRQCGSKVIKKTRDLEYHLLQHLKRENLLDVAYECMLCTKFKTLYKGTLQKHLKIHGILQSQANVHFIDYVEQNRGLLIEKEKVCFC